MPEITESELDRFLATEREHGTAFAVEQREEERADKYNADERDKAAKAGQAMEGGSYPIKDKDDLEKAIHAVGRGNASHNSIRAHIIARAKALNLSSLIPDNWQADGSIKEANAAEDESEHRDEGEPDGDECPTCEGSGKIRNGTTECPNCNGTGEVESGGPNEGNSADHDLEERKQVRELISGTVERRDFTASDVEVRTASDGSLRFSGYASTTETPYTVGGFEETFARGAFKRCLGEDPDVVLLINHEGIPLARTRSGTLTLSEDTRGLRVDAQLDPENPVVQTLVSPMKRGDMTEMSFAFRATDDEWSDGDRKRVVRAATIHKGDVSMVTHGANTDTTGTVAFRSEDGDFELRIGKALSNAKKAKLEAIKGEIDDILGAPDEPEVEVEPTIPGVTLIPADSERSSIEKDKARRAKVIARAA